MMFIACKMGLRRAFLWKATINRYILPGFFCFEASSFFSLDLTALSEPPFGSMGIFKTVLKSLFTSLTSGLPQVHFLLIYSFEWAVLFLFLCIFCDFFVVVESWTFEYYSVVALDILFPLSPECVGCLLNCFRAPLCRRSVYGECLKVYSGLF